MTGKKKKKILFIDYFSGLGGGQAVLLSVIKGVKKKYDPEVILLTKGPFQKALDKEKIRHYCVQTPVKVRYRYFWMFREFEKRLEAAIKGISPDIIYCNGFLAVKLCGPLAKRLGLPLLWHKHLIPEKGYFSYSSFQLRRAASFSKKIICVSEAARKGMIKAGVRGDKIAVIHNSVSPSGKIKAKLKLPAAAKGRLVFGAMGYLRKNKGFDIFIKAAEKVCAMRDDVFFLLAGKGEGADSENEMKLRELARPLKEKFIFTGYTDREAFYASIDCFVMPSPNEPFGMVTLDAQSRGIAVAGFACGGTGEIVENNITGWLTDEITADGLCRVINRAAASKKALKKAGLNARKRALTKFAPNIQHNKIAAIIGECLE